jgi:hypothetical protein
MTSALTDAAYHDLGANIATILGDGWNCSYEPEKYGRDRMALNGPDDAEIVVWRARYGHDGKLDIHGIYPKNETYDVKHVRIGVGETRGPAVVAREIQRRLLPDYLPELARIKADNARRADNHGARLALAKELAALIKGSVNDDSRSSHTRVNTSYAASGPRTQVEIRYDASGGNIEIHSLSADQLRAVVTLLTTF